MLLNNVYIYFNRGVLRVFMCFLYYRQRQDFMCCQFCMITQNYDIVKLVNRYKEDRQVDR